MLYILSTRSEYWNALLSYRANEVRRFITFLVAFGAKHYILLN